MTTPSIIYPLFLHPRVLRRAKSEMALGEHESLVVTAFGGVEDLYQRSQARRTFLRKR